MYTMERPARIKASKVEQFHQNDEYVNVIFDQGGTTNEGEFLKIESGAAVYGDASVLVHIPGLGYIRVFFNRSEIEPYRGQIRGNTRGAYGIRLVGPGWDNPD